MQICSCSGSICTTHRCSPWCHQGSNGHQFLWLWSFSSFDLWCTWLVPFHTIVVHRRWLAEPIPSIGSCLPSVFLHGLGLFFSFTYVSANSFQGGKKNTYLDKQAARFKKRQHQVRELQISKQRKKRNYNSMLLELMRKNKWLGIEEVAGHQEKLIFYGKLLTRKQ